MFGFLKEKLKSAIAKFTKKAESEAPLENAEEDAEEQLTVPEKAPEKTERVAPKIQEKRKGEPRKEGIRSEEPKKEIVREEKRREEPKEELKKEGTIGETRKEETAKERITEEKATGFFGKLKQAISTTTITQSRFDEMFEELEMAMLENNVAVDVIEKIRDDLKREIVDKPIQRSKVGDAVTSALHDAVEELFSVPGIDILEKAGRKKPLVICFVGINGSGKTTTIAKMARMFLDNKKSVVLAAADTFRAAAIDQLQMHADTLGVKLVKHSYGADPAAVAFDAIKHAQATDKDVVLIDTAGRLHSNTNLVDEMKKIVRVAKPDLVLFVGESITGNDCVEQARQFNDAVHIDGIILSKADVDEKGGAAISISYVTQKPILYLGTGQEYADLEPFNPDKMIAAMGL